MCLDCQQNGHIILQIGCCSIWFVDVLDLACIRAFDTNAVFKNNANLGGPHPQGVNIRPSGQ